jgi:sugar lactone lactonase YvrE
MRRRLLLFLAGSLVVISALSQAPPSAFEAAMHDYQAGDFKGYLAHMQRAAAERPNHPVMLFDLAGAWALNGDAGNAAATIRRLAAMQVWLNTSDHDFDPVRKDHRFRSCLKELDAVAALHTSNSSVAFTLPEKGLLTEGITWDPVTGAFFVSSTHKRKIVRIDGDGTTGDFVPAAADGMQGALGIKVDPARRLLWAATSPFSRVEGFKPADKNEVFLRAFDLQSGKQVKKFRHPKEGGFFDDLTVAGDGTVYVSDPIAGAVFRLPADATQIDPEPWLPRGIARSPQGLALSEDEKTLYVADYTGWILAVERASGKVRRLAMPPDFAVTGIDGLVRSGNYLIAIQNSLRPNRVVRLELSRDGLTIRRWKTLDIGNTHFDEPTLGTLGPRADYYFIAASQGHLFDEGKEPATEQLHDSLVLRLRL